MRQRSDGQSRLFSLTKHQFVSVVRSSAEAQDVPEPDKIGTHAFRRGMAQDIIDNGGSLAVLLRAGEWNSSAFLKYLRQSQPQEAAVAQAVIHLSDSEDDL